MHTFCTLPLYPATRSEERFLCSESNESDSLWSGGNGVFTGPGGAAIFSQPPSLVSLFFS